MSEPVSEHHAAGPETGGGHSRRLFLAGAGAGLAVTAVGVTAATEGSAATDEPIPAQAQVARASGTATHGVPMVAYVTDSKRGGISIQRRGREVVLNDASLVRALNVAFDRHVAAAEEN